MKRAWLPAVLFVAILPAGLCADDKDLLESVKARTKIEAQRVEREFTDGRAAAYKLVRSEDPKLADATEKLEALLGMVQKDTSLDKKRRDVLVVTLKWDLDKVKEIAAERRKPSRTESPSTTIVRRETPRTYEEERRTPSKDAKSIIDQRKGSLSDSRTDRVSKGDKFNRVMNDVERSAIPATEADRFPRDWAEKSRRRSVGTKMTAKEKAIMASLNKTIEVDFSNATFSEVIDFLKKKTGIDIATDKRGLDDAGVTYDGTSINLKLKASTRTVIRRLLADLGLAYFIKDEVLQITSQERARATTSVKVYYVGDLALVTDTRLGYALSKLQMLQTINQIVSLIKNVEPQSWKDNNSEAPGTIVFDPVRMTLVINQTSEFHFMMSGK